MYSETNRDDGLGNGRDQDFELYFWDWLLDHSVSSKHQIEDNNQVIGGTTPDAAIKPDSFGTAELNSVNRESQPLSLGELPTVQERFQSLLIARLKQEAELRPPLFPWESALGEIAEYVDDRVEVMVPQPGLWNPQHQYFNLPVPLPLFEDLLRSCQTVIQSSWREGVKLVRAVEGLFPNQELILNEMAGRVLMGEARSADLLTTNYDTATTTQKMALSLLAAQRLISLLSLNCPLNQPVSRQWLTAVGVLNLNIIYEMLPTGKRCLRVTGELPESGSLAIRDAQALSWQAKSTIDHAGSLRVEILEPIVNSQYILKVALANNELESLTFSLCLTE